MARYGWSERAKGNFFGKRPGTRAQVRYGWPAWVKGTFT